MKNQASNISVIIPAFNRASLIGETLWSLLNQTVPAKEIIVVDDGSTDGTADVVERIAEEIEVRRSEIGKERGAGSREQGGETALRSISDSELLIADCAGGAKALDAGPSTLDSPSAAKPRIRVIRQANAGPGAARNRGLAEATGEFVHFFDSDDIAAPNKHEVQLRILLETGADIAYGPWVKGRFFKREQTNSHERNKLSGAKIIGKKYWNGGVRGSKCSGKVVKALTIRGRPWVFVPEGPVLQAMALPSGSLIKALLTNWSIVPHAALFRKNILDKVGGFAEESFGYEDQFVFLRCLLAGAKVVFSPGTLELYRADNAGKLTEPGEKQKLFSVECARFIIQSRDEVEKKEWFSFHPPNKVIMDKMETKAPLESPEEWYGYRLRAYEAWRDLENFFPEGRSAFKSDLKKIWNRGWLPEFQFRVGGFLIRKLGGLKQRIFGHRWSISYFSRNLDSRTAEACGFEVIP